MEQEIVHPQDGTWAVPGQDYSFVEFVGGEPQFYINHGGPFVLGTIKSYTPGNQRVKIENLLPFSRHPFLWRKVDPKTFKTIGGVQSVPIVRKNAAGARYFLLHATGEEVPQKNCGGATIIYDHETKIQSIYRNEKLDSVVFEDGKVERYGLWGELIYQFKNDKDFHFNRDYYGSADDAHADRKNLTTIVKPSPPQSSLLTTILTSFAALTGLALLKSRKKNTHRQSAKQTAEVKVYEETKQAR